MLDLFSECGMNTSHVKYGENDYLGSELLLPGYEHLIDIPENLRNLFSECGMNTSQVEHGENDDIGSELLLPGYEHLIDIPENLRVHPGVQGLSVPTQEVTTSYFDEHPNRQSAAQCSNSELTNFFDEEKSFTNAH
ncbi:hypothetical protein Bhyg_03887 [Pseudolycoriella hygida]|uniref:Uncharacterized protein n=1 Tax=Pseudolycoriella hygida TaxID=35572 RepID=A0A9Q0NE48_9DIPT|nr:hypothetical protein Bhyg_03887 [Pseudolycoriella hygida]